MKLELPAEVLSLLNSMTKRIDELETRLEKIEQSDNEKAELIEKLKSDIHNFVQERDNTNLEIKKFLKGEIELLDQELSQNQSYRKEQEELAKWKRIKEQYPSPLDISQRKCHTNR